MYLLNNSVQWKKLKRFLLNGILVGKLQPKDKTFFKKKHKLDQLAPNSSDYKIARNKYSADIKRHLNPIHDQPIGTNFFEYQEHVETPSDRYTSYRIIVSARGKIIAASLLYSNHLKSNPQILESDFELPQNSVDWWGVSKICCLEAKNSRAFLNSKDFRSNISLGGKGIVLNPTKNSLKATPEEKEILAQHNINPQNPQIPQQITLWASTIGKTIGKEKSLYVGVDFIQNTQNEFFWLETNTYPGLQTYRDAHSNGKGGNNETLIQIHRDVIQDLF